MSRGRGRRPKHPGFGSSKHRKARVLRFASKNKGSAHVPCERCGLHRMKCVCHASVERIHEISRGLPGEELRAMLAAKERSSDG